MDTRRVALAIGIAVLAAVTLALTARCRSIRVPEEARLPRYDVEPYRRALAACVRDGRVDYAALRRGHAGDLDRYLDAVARHGPSSARADFPAPADRLAFHLNAYNAIMLRRWLDAGAGREKTPGAVNRLWFVYDRWEVDGAWVTLHGLEQSIIRPTYHDPRVHFALVCGAAGCPPLLAEPFAADRLDTQLDGLARRWLREPDGLDVSGDGEVLLSAIFSWYREDFEAMGGPAGVLDRYLDDDDPRREVAVAAARQGRIRFPPYDWSINAVADPAGAGP